LRIGIERLLWRLFCRFLGRGGQCISKKEGLRALEEEEEEEEEE
jgi:hypothetical protein